MSSAADTIEDEELVAAFLELVNDLTAAHAGRLAGIEPKTVTNWRQHGLRSRLRSKMRARLTALLYQSETSLRNRLY